MSVFYKCDRCGKEREEEDGYKVFGFKNPRWFGLVTIDYIVCWDCFWKIKDFIFGDKVDI